MKITEADKTDEGLRVLTPPSFYPRLAPTLNFSKEFTVITRMFFPPKKIFSTKFRGSAKKSHTWLKSSRTTIKKWSFQPNRFRLILTLIRQSIREKSCKLFLQFLKLNLFIHVNT